MLSKFVLVGMATVMIFAGTLLAQIAIAEPLIGYWSFDKDDGASDLSGTGNDGIIHGDPKTVEGMVGDALEFNGSTDYVEIPDNPTISELEEFSLSAWIRPSRLGAWVAVIEKAVHLNWSYGFFIEADGTLSLEVSLEGNNLVCCVGDFMLKVDTWYHVVCIYDGSLAKLYVDGNLEGEMPAAGPVNITEFPLTIGSRNGQNFFPGAIDEVTFWNKAVTMAQIEDPITREAVDPLDKLPVTWSKIKKLSQ